MAGTESMPESVLLKLQAITINDNNRVCGRDSVTDFISFTLDFIVTGRASIFNKSIRRFQNRD